MIRLLLLSVPLWLLTACSRLPFISEPPPATLADLEHLAPVTVPDERLALPQVGLDELGAIYRDVLAQEQDPGTRLLVLHRLADLEMLEGEADLAVSGEDAVVFAAAISAYEALLHDNPDYLLNDQILYQLSKAYDLSGQSEKSLAVLQRLSESHPESEHVLEAEFRRAENYFVDADYPRAEAAYARVIDYGPATPYYTRALYMQSWSRFKRGHYQSSIASFTATLDQLMPPDNRLEALSRAEHELVLDCLRVLAVVFSYLDGTQTIASAYDELGVRPYQHLLYQSLGTLYLSQERYRDSARTYQTYIRRFPDSKVAHQFQMRVIQAYEAGSFAELIITAKQDYVANFGVSGDYWQHSAPAEQALMRERLRLFIEELATYYHALAQAPAAQQDQTTMQAAYYASAGDYYQLFLDSFPADPETSRIGFMLAESRFESGNYRAAIAAYEWVAYSYPQDPRAPDAAYAGLLSRERLAEQQADGEQDDMRRTRVDSELRFAATFAGDPRAPAVLGHAAGALLQLEDYEAAIIAASTLTGWQPRPATELLVPAWLVIGHGHFQNQDYAAAELAYQDALELMAQEDQRYGDTVERLAASMYRQAEQAVARGDDLDAARRFHQVIAAAPGSSIRINAQYDAANAYLRAGDLEQANTMLIDFRQRYPEHELTASIGSTLVVNYEQLEQWREAAVELDAIYAAQPRGELQREALIVAAQYYDRVADRQSATARYRTYARDWPAPFKEYMETMSRLAELYELAGDGKEQRAWLEKIALAHDKAGAAQTERSRYLAAYSASVIADAAYQDFRAIELRHPVKQSLQTKKKVMDRALAAYTRSNDYAIEQFSTLATYRIALIYQQFGSDLLNSERPAALDALALEQYELMLEEQAYPFEEKAIAIHESNAQRSREGIYDEWVIASFAELAELLPARYAKVEAIAPAAADTGQALSESAYPKEVDNYNREAITLREQGYFAAAEQAYLASLASWESHAATHRNIGILYDLYLGEPDKALRHFNRYQDITGGQDRQVAGWIVYLERRQMTLAQGAL